MWFKVDDGFCMNPKTAMLSNDATALWLRSGTWAAQQLTKGRVPANMIPMFRCSDDSVQELCDAGLWEYDADKDEYVFHDWADYQPDGDEVDAKRRKRSEAGKKGASRRWKKPENGKNGKPMANAWQTDGKSMANSCPVPVPVPDKKEKEEYSSSFSKETGVKDFGDSRECGETDRALAVEYPNLDLESAWLAFAGRHQDETRAIGDWTRLWKGWCQRRANMSGIPPSKRHRHTWQCEHVLQALGRDKETATPDQQACRLAERLNKEQNTQ
jgi:hypothetical protein